jgi:hypothetical protein
MPVTIIPLSKFGKHHGRFAAIVDETDSDLSELSWNVRISGNACYARRTIRHDSRPTQFMHRVIAGRIFGKSVIKNMFIDHIDLNPLNNRRSNIRLATRAQNARNSTRRTNTSGYKGVHWHKRLHKWSAQIQENKNHRHLGYFDTAEAAAIAYNVAARKYHGEFARLNLV